MAALKLKAFGASTAIVIPPEMLMRLQVETGDTLFVVETPDGYLLTPSDPEADNVDRQIELGKAFMKKYRETFKRLAE